MASLVPIWFCALTAGSAQSPNNNNNNAKLIVGQTKVLQGYITKLASSPDGSKAIRDQYVALNAALTTQQDKAGKDVAVPLMLKASIERLGKSKMTHLGELLPTLVPHNKDIKVAQLEIRNVKALNVAEAMELSLKQNLQIGIAHQNIPITRWNYIGALGNFLPTVQLDANNKGTRNYTSSFPRKGTDTIDSKLFASLDYGVFQGGKVLFGSIAAHELYLASQGQFAATRNDTLNNAVGDYYSMLGNQVILNLRLDSALFSATQVNEFKKLFAAEVEVGNEALSNAMSTADDVNKSDDRVQKDLSETENQLDRLVKSLAPSEAKQEDIHSTASRIRQLLQEAVSHRQRRQTTHNEITYLWRMLKIMKANEEFKLHNIASTSDEMAESGEDALNLKDDVAVRTTATRIAALRDILIQWRTFLNTVVDASILASKSDTAAVLQCQQDPAAAALIKTVKLIDDKERQILIGADPEAPSFTSLKNTTDALIVRLDLIERRLQHWRKDNKVENDVIMADLSGLTDKDKPDGKRFLKLATDLKSINHDQIRLGRSLQDLIHTSGLKFETRSALIAAFRRANQASAADDSTAISIERINKASSAPQNKAKDAASFLVDLVAQSREMKAMLEADLKDNQNFAQKLLSLIEQLEKGSQHLVNTTSEAESIALRQQLSRLRETLTLLEQDSWFTQNLVNGQIDLLVTAHDVETTQAGFSYQFDQWNTQLRSDVQDLINQYITLRNSSIILATLLNLDQRTDLLSREENLALKARDLSSLPFVELVRETLNNRPELFQFDELRRAALANIGVASAALLPTASLNLTATDEGSHNSFNGLHRVPSYVIGFDVTYKFTNLLVPSFANVVSQGALAVQTYLKFRDQLNTVMQQVHQSYINVQTAQIRVVASAATAQKATEQLVMADTPAKRRQASASNLDVITALRDRNTNMVALATNMANYNSAQAQLLHDIGQIYPLSNYLAK